MEAFCTQCGKRAYAGNGNISLCVEHYCMLQQTYQSQQTHLASTINYLTAMMEETAGLPGVLPRFQISQPVINKGPINFHNIKVDNSVIGAINTGHVQKIDVALDYIQNTGNDELVKTIKSFTEAVLAEKTLDKKNRDEIIELISFITSQITASQSKRQNSVVKSVLGGLKEKLSSYVVSTTITTLWTKLQPLLEKIF